MVGLDQVSFFPKRKLISILAYKKKNKNPKKQQQQQKMSVSALELR